MVFSVVGFQMINNDGVVSVVGNVMLMYYQNHNDDHENNYMDGKVLNALKM